MNVENEYVQVNVAHVLRALFTNESAVELGNKINLHRIIRNHMEVCVTKAESAACVNYIFISFPIPTDGIQFQIKRKSTIHLRTIC